MIIDNAKKNRCGIFLFYDRDGIVDDYIKYMLSDLRKSLSYLLVVCNGKPSDMAVETLESVSDEVLIRANSGFDVGGYREGLFHIGFKELRKYDEVVMLNYTFFGSIYPFEEAFAKMSDMDLDFWGLTKHHKVDPDPFGTLEYGYLPEHIQSHFLVLRRSLFDSDDYKEFIISMKNPTTYLDSICGYEAIFTKKFEDKGYKWAVYVDTDRFENYVYSPVMFRLKEILEQDRCPIIKRRSFFTDYNDYLLNSCGESSVEAYEYLRENIDYDVNMIWDNILRLENISEVSKVMQLNYCNSSDMAYSEQRECDVSISIWVKSLECIQFYKKYIDNLNMRYSVYLFGDCEKIDAVYDMMPYNNVKKVQAKIEKISDFLLAIKDNAEDNITYNICCVIDDKGTVQPYSNKMSNIYKDWNCLLISEDYITNVRETFKENDRMGMGIPPLPKFGEYLPFLNDGWMGDFEKTKILMEEIGVKPNIKADIAPIFPLGGNFIIRRDILLDDRINKLLKKKEDDELVLLALPELVRSCGYYTGTLYSDNYAEIDITNSDYMFREMNKAAFEMYDPSFYCVVRDRIENNQLAARHCPNPEITRTFRSRVKSGLKRVLPSKMYSFGGKIYRKIRGRQ